VNYCSGKRSLILLKKGSERIEKIIEMMALGGIVTRTKAYRVPANALTWHRFFGSLLLALLILLFLSGAFLALYYSPVPGSAYDSVDYTLYTVPFGDMIKGVHHYSWNLLLVVIGLHLGRGFIFGAYKAPRQMIWISGVMIMLVVPALIITGDLLPWDQNGYWTTQVRLSIMQSVPLVGEFIVRLLQGGLMTGAVALTRFYILHILFLPVALILLISIHFHFIKARGLSGPFFKDDPPCRTISFFPQLVNRWLLMFLILTGTLGIISRYWPAPLGDPADPSDSAFVPLPEWWVLFLNQLVTLFKGSLALVGNVIIPGGLIVILIMLPFLDTSPDRHPGQRKVVILIAGFIVLGLLGLSLSGYLIHFNQAHG
jgi:ubiquinol-cytochrome c reductase cytochrome b subunit